MVIIESEANKNNCFLSCLSGLLCNDYKPQIWFNDAKIKKQQNNEIAPNISDVNKITKWLQALVEAKKKNGPTSQIEEDKSNAEPIWLTSSVALQTLAPVTNKMHNNEHQEYKTYLDDLLTLNIQYKINIGAIKINRSMYAILP